MFLFGAARAQSISAFFGTNKRTTKEPAERGASRSKLRWVLEPVELPMANYFSGKLAQISTATTYLLYHCINDPRRSLKRPHQT
jgi:hypothetical protein